MKFSWVKTSSKMEALILQKNILECLSLSATKYFIKTINRKENKL